MGVCWAILFHERHLPQQGPPDAMDTRTDSQNNDNHNKGSPLTNVRKACNVSFAGCMPRSSDVFAFVPTCRQPRADKHPKVPWKQWHRTHMPRVCFRRLWPHR